MKKTNAQRTPSQWLVDFEFFSKTIYTYYRWLVQLIAILITPLIFSDEVSRFVIPVIAVLGSASLIKTWLGKMWPGGEQ